MQQRTIPTRTRRGARRWLPIALAFAALALPTAAQTAADPAAEPPAAAAPEQPAQDASGDVEAERAPADKWNRGTPRSTVLGYLLAGRETRWADAAQFLDLSQVPEAERDEQGPRLARQLKFVLDQKLWVDLDKLSDDPAGNRGDKLAQRRELVGTVAHSHGDFEVFLDRVPRDDGVLIWKFAASTVARVPELYDEIGLGPIVENLPPALTETRFLEIALWQWIGLMLLVVAAWVAAWLLTSIIVRIVKPLTAKSETDIDDKLLDLVVGPLRLLVTIGTFNAALHTLLLSVPANNFAREVSKFLVIAGVAWLVFRVIDLFAAVTKENFAKRGQAGAVHLVPLGARAIKIAVGAMTVLATLDTFGFDITAIIAGLGVGGLAVALAAQKTVENIFGGVSVLIDQPVRPGDFCKFGDKTGTVEDIGVRSTRIRTLDRTVVSIPNAEFSTMQLENFALRDRIRLFTTLGLRYETTPDQLRHVIAGLRRLLLSHPKVLPEPLRVRFAGFGAYSLDIEMFAYVETQDINEFQGVREDIFLRVMQIVADSGTGFAFPSSTTYLARDGGLDAERTKAAEAQVKQWREAGKLMFPNYSPQEIQEMDDTLDWPPKGSAVGVEKS